MWNDLEHFFFALSNEVQVFVQLVKLIYLQIFNLKYSEISAKYNAFSLQTHPQCIIEMDLIVV